MVILGVILLIVIIYRIYVIVKEIISILKKPQFWLASVFLYFYIKVGLYIFQIPFAVAQKIDIPFFDMVAVLLALGILVLLCITYYRIGKKYPSFMLPIYFLFFAVSLGLIAFKLYNLGSNIMASNNDKEFVNPHHVNGYTKGDGTRVSDYWRDGDGNPNTQLTKDSGGGYFRKKG